MLNFNFMPRVCRFLTKFMLFMALMRVYTLLFFFLLDESVPVCPRNRISNRFHWILLRQLFTVLTILSQPFVLTAGSQASHLCLIRRAVGPRYLTPVTLVLSSLYKQQTKIFRHFIFFYNTIPVSEINIQEQGQCIKILQ